MQITLLVGGVNEQQPVNAEVLFMFENPRSCPRFACRDWRWAPAALC